MVCLFGPQALLTIHGRHILSHNPFVHTFHTTAVRDRGSYARSKPCDAFSIPIHHLVRGEITFGDGAPNLLARSGADVARLQIPRIGSHCMYPLAANETQYVTPNTCYGDATIEVRCSSPYAICATAPHSGALGLACYPKESRLLVEREVSESGLLFIRN